MTSAASNTNATPALSWRWPAILLWLYVPLWLLLAIAPVSRSDWLLENLLVLIAVPVLVVTRHRLRFSDAAYMCLFAFFVLHAIGAHYTYSLVPYDDWTAAFAGRPLNGLLGWDRNHYDRFVHFMYGALMLLPSSELLDRGAPPRGAWKLLLPVLFLMSHSVIYELVEWLAALIVAPDLGEAYLGTQGDEWDAQKDMALATGGALFTTFVRASVAHDSRRRLTSRAAP